MMVRQIIVEICVITDSRIKVIHKKNGGLSDARNVGIKNSHGEYLIFVDSDDILYDKAVELLYSLVADKKSQIGICNLTHIYSYEDIEYKKETIRKFYTPDEAICEMLYQKSFLVAAGAKIYKRSCFDGIEFPVGMIFEDSAIMYKLFENASGITYSDAQIYGYMHRSDSLTTKKFNKSDCDIIIICNQIVEHFSKSSDELQKAAASYQIGGALRIYLNAPKNKGFDEEIKSSLLLIKKKGWKVFCDKNVRRKTKIALLMFFVARPLMPVVYKRVNRWK